MSTTHDSGPRSNRNPILRDFRYQVRYKTRENTLLWAAYWADKLTRAVAPSWVWTVGATVSEQVFAARVLYRYAAVFGGVA